MNTVHNNEPAKPPNCGQCGVALPVGSKFCKECGAAVVRTLGIDTTPLSCANTPTRSGTSVPTGMPSRAARKLLWIVPVVTFLGWVIYSNSKQPEPGPSEMSTISGAADAGKVYDKYAARIQPAVVQPTVIQASQIVAAYVANEVAADISYKNRTLIVEGRIDTIGKDILDDPYVTLSAGESEFRSVQAAFKAEDLQQLANLSKGQLVKIEGTCEGLMMNVQVNNSRLVD